MAKTVDGITFDSVTYVGDTVTFQNGDEIVARRNLLNGYQRTGFSEPFFTHVTVSDTNDLESTVIYTETNAADGTIDSAAPIGNTEYRNSVTYGSVSSATLGTGATFTLADDAGNSDDIVDPGELTLNAGGTGYKVGNVLTLTGGDSNATLSVDTVDGSGAVVTFTILTGGATYTPDGVYATTVTGGFSLTFYSQNFRIGDIFEDSVGYAYEVTGVDGNIVSIHRNLVAAITDYQVVTFAKKLTLFEALASKNYVIGEKVQEPVEPQVNATVSWT